MVREALFQGMEWHMWLYYMPPIVKRIARNYRLVDPLADGQAELPIRYSFLLYEIFSYMRDWVMCLEDVPSTQKNVVLLSTRTDRDENGNIPKSSILALSDCLYSVLQSENIGTRVKRCLTNMAFKLYFDLRLSGKFDGYAAVLLTAMTRGKKYEPDNGQYRFTLAQLFGEEKGEYEITQREDHVLEVEDALQ
jgi:hypothetical protein